MNWEELKSFKFPKKTLNTKFTNSIDTIFRKCSSTVYMGETVPAISNIVTALLMT